MSEQPNFKKKEQTRDLSISQILTTAQILGWAGYKISVIPTYRINTSEEENH